MSSRRPSGGGWGPEEALFPKPDFRFVLKAFEGRN
jgi:hypothetical protein